MASPNVSFDEINASMRKPGVYIEYNTKLAVRNLPTNLQKVLIAAPMGADATAEPNTPVDIFDDDTAGVLFGYGSPAHLMAKAAIRANMYVTLAVMGLNENPAGIKAVAKVNVSGTVSQTGVISLFIGNIQASLAVYKDDTAEDVRAGLIKLINDMRHLPAIATAGADFVELTSKHAGASGNLIPLSISNNAGGISVSIEAFSGGQMDADLPPALNSVFGEHYQIIVSHFADQESLTTLREHIDNVSSAIEQRGARGIAASTGTLAATTTLAGQVNSGRISLALLPGTPSLPWEVAAAYAAVMASEEDPARPLNSLALTGIGEPPASKKLGRKEQETALNNGVTPLEVGPGGKVQIVRAISTYTKNAAGVEDVSLLDMTTIATLDYVRKACRERIALRFPREKLSSKTPPKVRSELIDVLYKLEELEIVEEVTANLPFLICERDSQDTDQLNGRIPADVVNGLHKFAGVIDLLL